MLLLNYLCPKFFLLFIDFLFFQNLQPVVGEFILQTNKLEAQLRDVYYKKDRKYQRNRIIFSIKNNRKIEIIDKNIDREKDRLTYIHTYRQAERLRNLEIERQTDKKIDKKSEWQIDRHLKERQIDIQVEIDRQIDGQTERMAD